MYKVNPYSNKMKEDYLVFFGNLFAHAGDYQKAIDKCLSIYKENPTQKDNLLLLANLYQQLKKPKEASQYYEEALKVEPNNVHALSHYALMMVNFNMENSLGRAFEFSQKAVTADSTYPLAWYAVAETNARKGNYRQSAEAFERYLNLQPNDVKSRTKLGILQAQNLNEYKKAIANLEEVLQELPDDTNVLTRLGLIYANKEVNNTHKALAYFQKALQLNPQNPRLPENIGIIYYERLDYNNALQYLKTSYAIEPNPNIAAYIADCLNNLNRTNERPALFGVCIPKRHK